MKFALNWASGFRGEVVGNCGQMDEDDGQLSLSIQ